MTRHDAPKTLLDQLDDAGADLAQVEPLGRGQDGEDKACVGARTGGDGCAGSARGRRRAAPYARCRLAEA